MSVTLGPIRFVSFSGDLSDLAAGRERSDALADLESRLPRPNSLRRANDDAKAAVLAASELLRKEGVKGSEGLGVYVGQQHMTLETSAQFLDTSYREGPRMVSPVLFTESVVNNVATHLSLTLGLKGLAQSFIGTRAAGIQAVAAAAEDVETGVVEAALVVALGVGSTYSRDAYLSVYNPLRRQNRPDLRYLRGSAAMLIRREAPGQPRISYVGLRGAGRQPASQASAVASLWKDAAARLARGTRLLDSTLGLARTRSRELIHRSVPTLSGAPELRECFALDPFARLLLDSMEHPGAEGRAVLCLGEEGTAALLALDGPARAAEV